MDDFQVIKQVISGNKQAFEKLVLRYQTPLLLYLGRMGMVQAEAEELAQETFLRAYRHLGRFDPQLAQFSTWLFTIARRLGINAMARRRVKTYSLEDNVAALDISYTDRHDDSARIKQRINEALLQLPMKYRSPIALAYLGDLGMADIAHVEGCSVGTVKSRIHRGKKRLQVMLADLIGENDHA